MQVEPKFEYVPCCLNAMGDDRLAMVEDSQEVSLTTIRRNCRGFAEWCASTGYTLKLTIDKDTQVSYHKSIYRGRPCYYIRHSAIEYVWIKEKEHGKTNTRRT